ncbi:MAG TPA: cupin domain-containing protein [Casimicrobiaceae bacterium]|nr:cupin domain-containing protein [Casimicrobiaceae bacterium]
MANVMTDLRPINLADKLAHFSEHWSPRVIAEMNDYQFKLVKFQGEFVWHRHEDTDEVFLVLDGSMQIAFRDGAVNVSAGEMFVIPKGREHITRAERECHALLIEPRGVVNTGTAGGALTAPNDAWI